MGVEAFTTPDGLFLSQQKYICDLLHRTNMLDPKDVSTPMSSTEPLRLQDGSPLVNATEYRRTVGAMQYLSLTRMDISFAVNKLSQIMHQPSMHHWFAVKRVLRYLKGTCTHGILIRKSASLNLHAFVDADWAGDVNDHTSISTYLVFLGATPISWSSKKPRTIAHSSTKAEYRSVASSAAEINRIENLLSELHLSPHTVPTIYCDNVGATYLCANPVFHSRMKHIAIDFHFVHDQIARN